jgi:YVTN family beta-propeller protein
MLALRKCSACAMTRRVGIGFILAISASTLVWASSRSTRVYVTNSEGDDITVIDLKSRKVIGDIQVGERVHGICAPADGARIFTTVESQHNLKIIDTTTDKIITTIALTGRPNQCASTPDGRYVGVPIRDRNRIDIVDTELKKVVRVLPVRTPHNSYNAGANNEMFVSSMGDHAIDVIDLKTMNYVASIPVGGIPRPYAVSPDGTVLYSALTDFHGFVIASIPERRVIARVELPPAPPSSCALEPRTPTHGLALTPDGKELWVTSLSDSGIYVYDVETKKLSNEIHTGKCPNWITISPDDSYVAVSNSASDDCSIIDAHAKREIARVKVGKGPKRLLAVSVP